MALQMILCVETNKKADTDSIYIAETIAPWYTLTNQIKNSKVYMNTKTRYRSKDVLKTIDTMRKAFTIGETRVIYCIDTDQYERNTEHAQQLEAIQHYCHENGYDLIWFCHDVEEVFCGQAVSDTEKVRTAAAFRRKKTIQEMQSGPLSSNVKRTGSSNILCVLDRYLPRK